MEIRFIDNTLRRLRVMAQLDLIATTLLCGKCKIGKGAYVYVYPKNDIRISPKANICIEGGLLRFSCPWFEVQSTDICAFEMADMAVLECMGSFDFVRGSKCYVGEGATLRLGNRSRVGKGGSIQCENNISIGNDCWISDDVVVSDSGGEVAIGDGVWIGKGAKIIGNISIGKNTVIGAGMTVKKDVAPESLII